MNTVHTSQSDWRKHMIGPDVEMRASDGFESWDWTGATMPTMPTWTRLQRRWRATARNAAGTTWVTGAGR